MISVISLRRQPAEIWIPPKYTSKECEFGNDKQNENEKTDSDRVKKLYVESKHNACLFVSSFRPTR